MNEHTIEKQITDLMQQCRFGAVIAPITPVSGGLMHKMYRVETDCGIYAVKCLNPEIMKRPGVLENYAQAEKIERILEEKGLPIVPALTIDGLKMQHLEDRYFYLFAWQEGQITDWHHISDDQCRSAGNILGRIHAIDPQNVSHKEPDISNIDWQTYARKAKTQKSEIAALLTDSAELLIYAESEWNRARAALPDIRCLTNEDMDPKNVMWDQGNAYLIDLECLDYGNPVSGALQLALQWAGITTCRLDTQKVISFFDGYLTAYDNCFRAYGNVFGLAYTWVEWLEYNIQRSLGEQYDDAERAMGICEVKNTIGRIQYIRDHEKEIKDVLDSRLPEIKAARYDNHDERICYYELLLEGDITEVPQYALPDGYRFVPYAENDRDAWIAIEMSAKEFDSYEQGSEAWNRYYAANLAELPNRMFFIETNSGEKIATATAFYDIHGRDQSGDGWLHWVAVRREYQGRGLSKPLISYVLRAMQRLGHTRAKIPTQTTTWLACKVYLDFGFTPIAKNLQRNREGWRIIEALTGCDIKTDVSLI